MVGVGETVMSKDLAKNKKLILFMDWESDEGLLEGKTALDGSLPGEGVMFYTLGITEGVDPDFERVLQEFRFRGGGDIPPKDVPQKPRGAFDKWYEKLTHTSDDSLDKVKRIRDEIFKALNNLSGEGPEPRYLLVEERHLRGLAESLELAAGAKRPEVIKESVLGEKKYVEKLIKESYSMTFEEGEALMERMSDNKSLGAESRRGTAQTHRVRDKTNPAG